MKLGADIRASLDEIADATAELLEAAEVGSMQLMRHFDDDVVSREESRLAAVRIDRAIKRWMAL